MGEVRSVCADLVFVLFICPAICDPEPHGITTDIPISHIARHNLMQMAQIIQVLAISQWEEIDAKVQDLYGKFEKVWCILLMLNEPCHEKTCLCHVQTTKAQSDQRLCCSLPE